MKKIEIILWYKCNTICAFCTSRAMEGDGFSTREAAGILAEYRARGITDVDFGGGEPTTREDLLALARVANKLGYSKIGVKSNGARFCYPGYARGCLNAGINHFSISLWGHNPETHDALAGRARAFEMTEMGIKHLVDFGAHVCVDFLITTETVDSIKPALEKFRAIGVKDFQLWLFSIFGAGGMRQFLPRLSAAGRSAVLAAGALSGSETSIRTSHIFPCFLPGHEDMYYNIREIELLIITPGRTFRGEESPFEAGVHIEMCKGCVHAARCAGPRPEYLEAFGAGAEFKKTRAKKQGGRT